MKISVVIPTYKRPQLLINCLHQLAKQDFAKSQYEVIVVTDGPDADTSTAVKLFAERHILLNIFCYHLRKKNGPATARNKGVKQSSGELIVFTDDDCLPQQSWLTAYWNAYENASIKNIAFTGKTIVPNSNPPTDYEKNIANLETAEFITANCAIAANSFETVDGFDENFTTSWREDSDLHFKLVNASIPIEKIMNAVVIHPVRKVQWGISLKEQKKSLFNVLLYKKHKALYRERISAKSVWNYYLMICLLTASLISVINNHQTLTLIFFAAWLILFVEFVTRRLHSTSKRLIHVTEMIITSAIIPFLSVFWILYGSIKYKTLLL